MDETLWLMAEGFIPNIRRCHCHNSIRPTGQAPLEIQRLPVKRAAANIACNGSSNAICRASSSVALAWLKWSSADRSRSPAVAPSRRAHHRSGRPVVNAIYRPLSGFSGNSPFSFHFNPFHPILILFVCFRPFPLVISSFLHSSLLFKLVVTLFCYFVFLNTLFSGKTQIAPLAIISKRHTWDIIIGN